MQPNMLWDSEVEVQLALLGLRRQELRPQPAAVGGKDGPKSILALTGQAALCLESFVRKMPPASEVQKITPNLYLASSSVKNDGDGWIFVEGLQV